MVCSASLKIATFPLSGVVSRFIEKAAPTEPAVHKEIALISSYLSTIGDASPVGLAIGP